MFDLTALREAARLVHASVPATAQYAWPRLAERLGCEVWVKHENHAPTGAFKVRGGLLYVQWLLGQKPQVRGLVTATRGNHGQKAWFWRRVAPGCRSSSWCRKVTRGRRTRRCAPRVRS